MFMVREGQLLAGKYRLEYLVGKGSFASVWAARNTFIDRMVALKVLSEKATKNPMLVERFAREAKLAARPIHPVIVAVEDLGQTQEGAPFLVMELLKGHTVAEAIKASGAFSWLTAVEIARLFLEGLAAAHTQDIIHRDIKPANVYLTDPGSSTGPPVRLLDLGLARDMAEDQRLTRTGQVMGTANYLSPEALLDRQPKGGTKAGDVFASGLVLFAMLTSRLPFEPSNRPSNPAAEVAAKAKLYSSGEPLPGPVEFDPTIPDPIDAVVRRALQIEPSARYVDANEMLNALIWASQKSVPATQAIEFDDLSRTVKWLPGRTIVTPPPAGTTGLAAAPSSPSLEAYGPEEVSVIERAPANGQARESASTPMSWSPDSDSLDLSWQPNPVKWLGITVGVLALVLLAGGAVLGLLRWREQRSEMADVPVERASGEVTAPAAAPADDKDLVTIELAGLPESAEVSLDGHPISGGSLASPPGSHRVLEVRAPGQDAVRLDLDFDVDRTLVLADYLRPASPQPPPEEAEAVVAVPAAPAVPGPVETPAAGAEAERPAEPAATAPPPSEEPRRVAQRPRPRPAAVRRRAPRDDRVTRILSSGITDPWAQ
jgi:serine/threonine-protein kinase